MSATDENRLAEVQGPHQPQAAHCIQEELASIRDPQERFTETFECGDALFDTEFNVLDGVGANVDGHGTRFTRVPRSDMLGAGQWGSHTPERATGPNGTTCLQCHNKPFSDGAGDIAGNVFRDPLHSGSLASMIQRNAPHVFAPGAVQLLAEEMTVSLQSRREFYRNISCQLGGLGVPFDLVAKGVGFGSLTVQCSGNDDTSAVRGVSTDLVIRPFQWKGENATLRDFNRGAAHNEIGMQPVETAGDDVDGDGDGVANELGIGDMSALTVYLASQPRPVTKLELNRLGLLEPALTRDEIEDIQRGAEVFEDVGCAGCHVPRLDIKNPIFAEPSPNAMFRDELFPAGQDPVERGVDPENPLTSDLTADQPDNIIEVNGEEIHLGSLETADDGDAIVRLYGDLKRHDLGEGVTEYIDEIGTGASVFLTENLWGVGSTAPYLHDGRATTLTEAILAHGAEAAESRDAFLRSSENRRVQLITFLNNLILFKVPEEEE